MHQRLTSIHHSMDVKVTPDQIRGVIDMAIEEGEHRIHISRIDGGKKRITVTGIGHESIFMVDKDFKVLP